MWVCLGMFSPSHSLSLNNSSNNEKQLQQIAAFATVSGNAPLRFSSMANDGG